MTSSPVLFVIYSKRLFQDLLVISQNIVHRTVSKYFIYHNRHYRFRSNYRQMWSLITQTGVTLQLTREYCSVIMEPNQIKVGQWNLDFNQISLTLRMCLLLKWSEIFKFMHFLFFFYMWRSFNFLIKAIEMTISVTNLFSLLLIGLGIWVSGKFFVIRDFCTFYLTLNEFITDFNYRHRTMPNCHHYFITLYTLVEPL